MFAWMNKVFHANVMNQVGGLQIRLKGDREIYKQIRKNQDICQLYKGKKCYILGNGPSLKNKDLSFLKGEYVFSVNSFSKSAYFEKISPQFHFWADPSYFDGTYSKEGVIKEWEQTLKKGSKEMRIFLPYTKVTKAFMEEHFSNIENPITYFYTLYDPHIYMKLKPNLTKPIPICRTVVQLAIISAIYMGFEEIYLMGCDGTSVLNDFTSILEQKEIHEHFYEKGDEFKKVEKISVTSEYVCYAQYRVFLIWRLISEYCTEHNIIIKNVIDRTLIDSIPRMTWDEFMEDIG